MDHQMGQPNQEIQDFVSPNSEKNPLQEQEAASSYETPKSRIFVSGSLLAMMLVAIFVLPLIVSPKQKQTKVVPVVQTSPEVMGTNTAVVDNRPVFVATNEKRTAKGVQFDIILKSDSQNVDVNSLALKANISGLPKVSTTSRVNNSKQLLDSGMTFPLSLVKTNTDGSTSVVLLGLNMSKKTSLFNGQTIATVALNFPISATGARYRVNFDPKSTKLLDSKGGNMVGLMQDKNVNVQ